MNNDLKNLNPDDFWPAAEKVIDKHFRRKRILRWSVMAILLAIVTTFSYFALRNTDENLSETKSHSIESNTLADNQSESNLNNTANEMDAAGAVSSDASKTENLRDESVSASSNKENTNFASNSSTTNTRQTGKNTSAKPSGENELSGSATATLTDKSSQKTKNKEKKTTEKIALSTTANSEENTALNSAVTRSTKKKKSKSKAAPTEVTSGNIQETVVSSTSDKSNLTLSKKKNKKQSKSESNPVTIPSNTYFSEQKSPAPTPLFIAMLDKSSGTLEAAEFQLTPKEKNFPSASRKNMFKSWYVNVYGIYSYSANSLNSSTYSRYVERRSSEEKSAGTPGMGVTTTFRINKVNISTGIEYTGNTVKTAYSAYLYKDVVSTRSSWQTQILSYLVTDTAFIQGIQYLYNRSISYTDSSLIIISDTSNQRVASQVQNGQLQLNYLEIPLSIGYQFVTKRVGIGASAGISAAFLMSQKGNVISTDESRILQAKQENFYRRMVWNVRVGLDVSYQLSGRTAILISPQYRFGIQSIYKPESGLKQRNAAFTMLAGFRYLIY